MLDPLIYLIRANRRHCVEHLLPSQTPSSSSGTISRLGSRLRGEELTVDLVSAWSLFEKVTDCSHCKSLGASSVLQSTFLPGGGCTAPKERFSDSNLKATPTPTLH